MTMQNENTALVSKGVDQLIARLRDEGVNRGEATARELINDAQATAHAILDDAKKEAQKIKNTARKEAEEFTSAGQSAIKTAMRDMILQLKLDLTHEFSEDLKRLVTHQLQQPEILTKMILELVGRTARDTRLDTEDNVEIVLPEKVLGLEALRNDPDALAQGEVMDFVFGLTRDMLQEGITFRADTDEDQHSGLCVKLTDKDLELDLTETAVASLLLQHLQPRFRAILEGVVR